MSRNQAKKEVSSSKKTPMMQQYLSVKAAYPGTIVLFRMGDFFETFYDDAKECARLLDITLTARSKEKDPVPMAGVPHHAIDGYIARLINEHRRTVVIVDQVEDPKTAKGLVRREVTRVLTPGTYLDPNAPGRLASYLVSVAFPTKGRREQREKVWGLAALDLSTGELRATSGESHDQLLDEILRLQAKEVVLAESSKGDVRVARMERELDGVSLSFAPEERSTGACAKTCLEDVLGKSEAAGLKHVASAEALRAAGMALAYAADTQLRDESFEKKRGGSLAHVTELKPYLPGDSLVLDVEARTHLELFRAADGGRRGSLLDTIDEAVTPMGGRMLARWLARPELDLDRIRARHDAVDALLASPSALDEARSALEQVYDLERLLGRLAMGRANPRDLAALRVSLDEVPAVLECARVAALEQDDLVKSKRVRSARLNELGGADGLPDVRDQIADALVDEPVTELGKGTVFRQGFDAELDELTKLSADGKQLLLELELRERESTGIGSLKVKYNRVFGYFIEVTKSNLSAVPEHYVRKQTMVNGERYYTEELKTLEEKILGAEGKRLLRETDLFNALIERIAREVRRLQGLADVVAEVDVLTGFAQLAERRGYTRPVVDDGEILSISDGRHPVLEALSKELEEAFVPNDLEIGERYRLMIITGPNMAGKSTIMRQTALIVVLAQMGCFVPAKEARIGLVDRVFTRVGASDELSKGRSTFMVEMTETARILRSATARSLILLDEIGRGTSTFDGLSIAWAVAEYLHDTARAKTLFATHYHELTEICRDKPMAANFHVSVKEWNDEIVFLRKLVRGSTNRSYGVQVARLAGLPLPVVERARAVLASLEAQDLSAGDHSVATRAVPIAHGDQLHLFGGVATAIPPEVEALLEAIRELSIDDTTPRAALDLIAAWKKQIE